MSVSSCLFFRRFTTDKNKTTVLITFSVQNIVHNKGVAAAEKKMLFQQADEIDSFVNAATSFKSRELGNIVHVQNKAPTYRSYLSTQVFSITEQYQLMISS